MERELTENKDEYSNTVVSVEEFNELCTGISIPEMNNVVYGNVVKFYTVYTQGRAYRIVGDPNALNLVFEGCEDVYTKFGIFRESSVLLYPPEVPICFIKSVDDSVGVFEAYKEEYGRAPEYLAVLCDDVSGVVSVLQNELQETVVMNRAVTEQGSRETSRPNGFKYVDITDIINEAYITSVDANLNIAKIYELLKTIRGMGASPTTIYCIKDGVPESIRSVYLVLATILMYDGFNFEIKATDRTMFVRSVIQTLAPCNMLLNDYLWKLAHPVSFGAYFFRNVGYMCVLEKGVYPEYHALDFQLELLVSEVREDSLSLVNQKVDIVMAKYSGLDIVDAIDLFGLEDTSIDENGKYNALRNHIRLSNLISEFEESIVSDVKIPDNVTLNFTNILFFKNDGKLFVGYVPRLPDVAFDYTFVPLCDKYQAFHQRLSREEYDKIIDMNILVERDALKSCVGKYAYHEMEHFRKPRFLDGMVQQCFPTAKTILTSNCGLSLPEVGIWSAQTTQGRTTALSFLLGQFDRIYLHDARFLTFWGGCHPMDLTRINIDYKVWRNDNVE